MFGTDYLVVVLYVYCFVFVPSYSADCFLVECFESFEFLLEIVDCAHVDDVLSHSRNQLHYKAVVLVPAHVYLLNLAVPKRIVLYVVAESEQFVGGVCVVYVACCRDYVSRVVCVGNDFLQK